jgi:hypothetical protein
MLEISNVIDVCGEKMWMQRMRKKVWESWRTVVIWIIFIDLIGYDLHF